MPGEREAVSGWAQQAKKNAGWLVALGVLTVLAGVGCISAPMLGGVSVSIFIGVALVVAGMARAVSAFHAGSFGQGALAFFGGILTLLAGGLLVTRPGVGVASLTLFLGVYLLMDGISGAFVAFRLRPENGWGWMLFHAGIGGFLGILLLREWPLSGLWAIGTLVGINLLFAGFSIIAIGSGARSLAKRVA